MMRKRDYVDSHRPWLAPGRCWCYESLRQNSPHPLARLLLSSKYLRRRQFITIFMHYYRSTVWQSIHLIAICLSVCLFVCSSFEPSQPPPYAIKVSLRRSNCGGRHWRFEILTMKDGSIILIFLSTSACTHRLWSSRVTPLSASSYWDRVRHAVITDTVSVGG